MAGRLIPALPHMMRSDVVNAVLEKRLRSDCSPTVPNLAVRIPIPGPPLASIVSLRIPKFPPAISTQLEHAGLLVNALLLIRLKYFPMVCPMANHHPSLRLF